MYRGVAIWNYAGDAIENAHKFADAGFDAISWNAPLFVGRYTDKDRERVAEYISNSGQYLTMHNFLPSPYDPAEIASARHDWRVLSEWHQRYGLLRGMTFDFVHPHEDQLPLLAECLTIFRGQGVFFACEDTPLHARTMEKFAKYLTPEDDFGILIDLGHLNIRQWKMELHEPEDFERMFRNLPLPVRELHVHDNKGRQDEHRELGAGNLPLADVVRAVKAIGFDGIVTVEIVNSQQWDIDTHIAHALDTSNRFYKAWNDLESV